MGDVSAMPENMFYPGVSLFLQSFVPFFCSKFEFCGAIFFKVF